MEVLKWLFGEKEKEIELKYVRKFSKELKYTIPLFNNFYILLERKKKIIDSGEINTEEIKELNKELRKTIRKLLLDERFDERLLRHILVESATRLHHISDELGIKILGKSPYINNLEEAKRRSYNIIHQESEANKLKYRKFIKETKFEKLMKETLSNFGLIRKKLRQYRKILYDQKKVKNINESLKTEKEFLDDFFEEFKKFVNYILDRTKNIVKLERVALRKETLFHVGGKGKEALLIFHSYVNTPQENMDMAGYFAEKGYSVYAPRLPGHGTIEDELYNTSAEETMIFGQACLDYFYEKNGGKPVFLTGLSLGGMMVLNLAIKKENFHKIKAIIPMNAYIKAGIEVFLERLPFGGLLIKGQEKFTDAIGKTLFWKKSLNLMRDRRNHFMAQIAKLNFKGFLKSYEDKYAKEFRERIDKEFEDIIKEKIKLIEEKYEKNVELRDKQAEKVDEIASIENGYREFKDRLEKEFREKYQKGKISHFDIQDLTKLLEVEFYNVFSYKGKVQLNELSLYLQANMSKIKAPVFVIQSRKDRTVDPISAKIIYDSCKNSSFRRKLIVGRAGHVLTLERRRYFVFGKIEKFIDDVNSKYSKKSDIVN